MFICHNTKKSKQKKRQAKLQSKKIPLVNVIGKNESQAVD